ncbi:MAG: alpha-hydroxy-acid oxidizing protein, partial [Candidatus Thermoplasmatota archaeon]|nr:alpha-hydroxy-acid oxidizing protein [Candidatus Thermoplasmatota archaeon]
RKWTKLPILIKGITHPDDVELAFKNGADGVVISNHGGRQVDGAMSSIDALSLVDTEAYADKIFLLDSGIRHAADAVKALAMGASAVLIGRPYAYALSVAGSKGVERFMSMLRAEMDLQMALAGFRHISELNRGAIYRSR